MSSNQQNKNNEEEVDLGSLFVIIGKGFSKLFAFIASVFKEIFNFLILIVIFLKENLIKIVIAGFVGLVIGLFLEVKKPTTFGSDLLVEPNFKSARQLYNNVNYYNDLVKQKDTTGLEETFKIDKETAASLKKFEIEPIVNDIDIINSYNDFILEVDTATVKSYDFKDFKLAFTDLDYKIHKIKVVAEKNNVFIKLDDVIISSVVNNKYFERLKKLTNENLNRTDSMYRQNLSQIDSLRKVYMQVMIEEAKKQTSGTSIDLGGEKKTTKELELFETNRRINSDLKNIVIDKSEKYEVINVISNFQPVGYEIKGITKNYAFLLAAFGAVSMIILLMLLKLNKYLTNYKK
ncbi:MULTISPECIES: hypothetical protein [unclassified Polaribacter]|uniref:hypothetical protein n=1 Tax=unclassified Polaribacter TaxID=196858 RepID=UPI0011BFB4FF|nr:MULTISPECIES: hypothetical protein [unclassified Polaribacter]TXD54240.1 hypothetical protein ES043_01700 [Polaribacter sp. IC063]TXD57118.1 hypothetical protein ES044_15760 [Polaribacter sp. IC066]